MPVTFGMSPFLGNFGITVGNRISRIMPFQYTLDGSETVTVQTETGAVTVPLRLIAPYADSRNPKPYVGGVRWPGQNTFTLFEQAEGTWSSIGAGTRTYETTDPYYGSGFQRVTTDGIGGTSIVRITQLPLSYDATGKTFAIAFKVDDISKIEGIRIDLGSANLANRNQWNNIIGSQEVRSIQDGAQIIYTFSLGAPDATAGTFDITDIDCFQVRITDKGTGAVVFDLERMFFFDATPAASCVTIDDSYRTWYTLAKPVLDRYDILSTMFAIERYSNPDHEFYDAGLAATRLTEAMIAEMVEQGHELAYHEVGNDLTANTPEGDPWTAELIQASIDSHKAWAWNTFGVDVVSAAYPGGETREITGSPGTTIRDVFADNFAVSRTINKISADTLPTGDRSLVRCYGYVTGNGTEYTSAAVVDAKLTEIDTYGGVISWSFHNIVDETVQPEDPGTNYSLTDFEYAMSAIRAKGVRIATMQELYGIE